MREKRFVFLVKLTKPKRSDDSPNIAYVVEAQCAAKAVKMVNDWTGMYDCSAVSAEMIDAEIYKKNLTL